MRLVEELRAEHERIERALGSLRTFVAGRVAGTAELTDGARFVRFFRLYAGDFHHAREEDVLFTALHDVAELPVDRGPIAVMLADHRRLGALLDELEQLLAALPDDQAAAARLGACATAYAHGLWHHIDAENSVLFPEGEARLTKRGVHELASRPPTDAELSARDDGEALVARYAPTSDLDAFRGDACAACPAFGRQCRGFEREWWSDLEWDEIDGHLPSG